MIDNINYIGTGERIDGENAPDSRPDILNRPTKELLSLLNDGNIKTIAESVALDVSAYTISPSVNTDDVVRFNTVNSTIEKNTSEGNAIGIINVDNTTIYIGGKYEYQSRNDLIIGKNYFVSGLNHSDIVSEDNPNKTDILVGIASNSNELSIKVQKILSDTNLEIVIDDNQISQSSTYSSQKISDDYVKKVGYNSIGGFTKDLDTKDRFSTTNDPYKLIDTISEPVVFRGGEYERSPSSELILPEAPFDPSATDELLDDKVNSLVCQQAHSKGDIVVKRGFINENPNFKNGLVGYNDENTYWSISNEKAIHAVSSIFNPLSVDISDVPDGAYFTIFFNIDITSGSGVRLSERQVGVTTYQQFIVDGLQSQTVKKTVGSNIISFSRDTVSVGFSLDDVYVYIGDSKDSIKQATRDTSEMKDFDDTNTSQDIVPDDVVFCSGINPNGISGHYYLSVNTVAGANLSTFNLGSTTFFIDLGTASNMDLRNPYFQTLNQVTRQDVITLRKNKTTNIVDYYTFKGTKYFGGTHSQKEVMEAYGFSQIGSNLWEDVDYEYVFVKLTGSLNAGAYHQVYNSFGTRSLRRDTAQFSARTWWASNAEKVHSTYNTFDAYYLCINASNGTGDILDGEAGLDAYGNTAWSSSRPDRLFYNKAYLVGKGGLLGNKLPYAGKVPEEDLLREESNEVTRESFLEEGVEVISVKESPSTNPNAVYVTVDNMVSVGDTLLIHINGVVNDVYVRKATAVGTGGNGAFIGVDTPVAQSIGDMVAVMVKRPYLLTYGEDTTTDIIGSLTDYPSDWLEHLSSGKGIVGNALLVGQDGTDYIPDGTFTLDSVILSKKGIVSYDMISSADSGIIWSNYSPSIDSISNTLNDVLSMNAGVLRLISYSSANQALVQDEPQKVISVLPKAVASNKHNNLMPYTATRKVPVGNGSNGDESRTLENDYGLESYHINSNSTSSWSGIDGEWTNTRILHNSASSASYTSQKTFGVYEFRGSFTGTIADLSVADLTLTEGNDWYLIANGTTPEHNTINLDNSDSSACKWFNTLAVADDGEYVLQVHTKELAWDFGKDNRTEFTNINPATFTGSTVGEIYTMSDYKGTLKITVECEITTSALINTFQLLEGGLYDDDGTRHFKFWDGNGFGDNNKFDSLTNDTQQDLNDNTILTKVLTKRLGKWRNS